jgi:hypothetical protein
MTDVNAPGVSLAGAYERRYPPVCCRRSSVIAWVIAVLGTCFGCPTLAAGAAPANEPQAAFAVFDAHGKQVGQVVGVEAGHGGPSLIYVVVRLKVGAHAFVLSAHRDRLVGNTSPPAFESRDCSGQPFLVRPMPDAVLPAVAVVGPRAAVYLAAPEAAPRAITARSHFAPDGSCLGGPETHLPERIPALELVELAAHFSPPFQVR